MDMLVDWLKGKYKNILSDCHILIYLSMTGINRYVLTLSVIIKYGC